MQQAHRDFEELYRRVKENGGADADFQARAPTSHLQLLCVLGRCSAVPDAPLHTPQVHVELVPPLRQVPRGMCACGLPRRRPCWAERARARTCT
jgi:hypothetical protein